MACPFPSAPAFLKRMRLVLAREWTDMKGGRAGVATFDRLYVDGSLELDGPLLRYTDNVLVACKRGNVIPGYGLDLDTGECFMDWPSFACFARWYAQAEKLRPDIREELKKGNPAPWTAPGMPGSPEPCSPTNEPLCCPSSVWLDPFYQETVQVEEHSALGPALAVAAAAALSFGALYWFTKGK